MTQHNQFLDGVFSEATSLTHLLDTNDKEHDNEAQLIKHSAYYGDTKFSKLLTLSDPGYFRQLTIRGGALTPPPYNLENYCVNHHHIIHVNFTKCFRHDPIGIFSKIRDFDHFTAISK